MADLERARRLARAADEGAAKDLLLSLLPAIETADRDDWALEVFAQLGELYLVRTAYDGVTECLRRIDDCLAAYVAPSRPVTMAPAEVDRMRRRYARRARFLRIGLAAAHGEHETADAALCALADDDVEPDPELAEERGRLLTHARILCATALCDDDLHVRSVPLWDSVFDAIGRAGDGGEADDQLLVLAGLGYGRFCVETGRLTEAEPWLRRAEARARQRGWRLAASRAQLERATAAWSAGDRGLAQTLTHSAYPDIAEHLRAHDVSRCWLYFGLISLSIGELDDAEERFGHAERHWREIEKPLHIHRILVQRSWVDIMRGDFGAARERVGEARALLDGWSRHSWLQYARLDDHLGSIWRADALADPAGLDAKMERAVDLKAPAALAVDSVRHAIADADARMRWASHVSAPILAGAFAAAWEWGNTALVAELIEYHGARGSFSTEYPADGTVGWSSAATAAVPIEDVDTAGVADYALVAGGTGEVGGPGLTRLGPLPPLVMDPTGGPIISRYRAQAAERYDRGGPASDAPWATWP